MPSKRFWAKKNPKLDFEETVNKTQYFINNYNFKKFIHISSISARCEKKTTYGKNKLKSDTYISYKLKIFFKIIFFIIKKDTTNASWFISMR